MTRLRGVLRALSRNASARIGGAVLVLVVGYCVLVPLLSPYDPNDADFTAVREPPSAEHWLGTDQYGRDVFTRLAAGGATTLLIAGGALALILALGVSYGLAAGLAGGRVDSALMRLLDGLLAIPRLPVSIVILVVLSLSAQNVQTIVFALAIVNWMITARLVRGEVVSLKRRDFVRAAQVLGAGRAAVARRHILPNSLGIVLVAVFLELPAVILGESFLAVLGLGPEAPTPTWGNIALEGITFGRLWLVFLPSLAIAVFAVSANLLADGLHDALDPRRWATGRRARGYGRRPAPAPEAPPV
ncbi:MAG TPA: ABC transporter permease [Gaiellaceae bacterium]|nr:ABC transporter permease [Gaiellaceae bacterium]